MKQVMKATTLSILWVTRPSTFTATITSMSLATTMATQATVLRIPLVALATLVLGLSLAMPTTTLGILIISVAQMKQIYSFSNITTPTTTGMVTVIRATSMRQ